MQVGILDPLRVVADDGGVLDVGGSRRRAPLALLDEAVTRNDGDPVLTHEIGVRAMWSTVAVELEAATHAEALYAPPSPWAGRIAMSGPPACGAVDHHRDASARVRCRDDAAAEHLHAAEEAHARLGASYRLAATRLERSRPIARARGGEHAATELLQDARAVARARGDGGHERDATTLIGAR